VLALARVRVKDTVRVRDMVKVKVRDSTVVADVVTANLTLDVAIKWCGILENNHIYKFMRYDIFISHEFELTYDRV
jgi:hypothetical protein